MLSVTTGSLYFSPLEPYGQLIFYETWEQKNGKKRLKPKQESIQDGLISLQIETKLLFALFWCIKKMQQKV